MLNVHWDVFPQASVAETTTVDVPIGNTEPEAGEAVTTTFAAPEQLSVAVGYM